jgi:hypothetical protein
LDEDKLEDHMQQEYLDDVANQNDFLSAERVSARTGENVNEAISKIVREVLMRVYFNERGVEASGTAPNGF